MRVELGKFTFTLHQIVYRLAIASCDISKMLAPSEIYPYFLCRKVAISTSFHYRNTIETLIFMWFYRFSRNIFIFVESSSYSLFSFISDSVSFSSTYIVHGRFSESFQFCQKPGGKRTFSSFNQKCFGQFKIRTIISDVQ